MPRGNGTGPNGQGPKTGQGLGTCNGEQSGARTPTRNGNGNGFGNRNPQNPNRGRPQGGVRRGPQR